MSHKNLRKTPDRLQKIARWQHCTKKCKKSKKCNTQDCFQVNLFYVKCKKTKIYSTFKVKFTAKCKKCGLLRIFCN